MWAIRILTGAQSGQVVPLKSGRNILGRGANCDVQIANPGISKEHAEIQVLADKISITDLRSSNGTYVNGVRIQTNLIRLGDKVGVHDILFDVVPAAEGRQVAPRAAPMPSMGMPSAHIPPQMSGGMDESMAGGAPVAGAAPAYVAPQGPIKQLLSQLQEYVERVALPGVYKLPEYAEFKFVILGFVAAFIFVTTLLSMIPMVQITRASIVNESMRRAQSIARTVATLNQSALLQNQYNALSTHSAETEEGVTQVLIIQHTDGMILAPASRAGTTPDLPFVHQARRETRPYVIQVDNNTIGASFPIGLYDPNTGEQSVKAHAVVLYDIGSLAFDDGQAISLFMQTLIIASLVGLLVYFFMYKLIEYPLVSLNAQLDAAMRDKTDNTSSSFQFPALQALIGNINSLLTRYVHGETGASGGYVSKDGEAENLVQLIGYPAVAIATDGRVMAANGSFAQVARADLSAFVQQAYQKIPDAALQANLESLMARSQDNPRMIHTDNLEFSGHPCIISCQAMGSGSIDYFLVTVAPNEGGG